MYYHVRIYTRPRSSLSEGEIKLDFSEDKLRERIIIPYYNGEWIVINGKTIPLEKLDRITICKSAESSSLLMPSIRERRAAEEVRIAYSDDWYIFKYCEDVTDELITGPPRLRHSQVSSKSASNPPNNPADVFVIHGRNENLRRSMFNFLRAINLNPLEWNTLVDEAEGLNPYIGDILDLAFSKASAIVVLMTPDDVGMLKEIFHSPEDPSYETTLSPQARLNVIFEAGMAMGRCEDRTIIVEVGFLRPFSDIVGRHVVRLNNRSEKRKDFAKRLTKAGCPVNLDGEDWLTVGEFTVPADDNDNDQEPPNSRPPRPIKL